MNTFQHKCLSCNDHLLTIEDMVGYTCVTSNFNRVNFNEKKDESKKEVKFVFHFLCKTCNCETTLHISDSPRFEEFKKYANSKKGEEQCILPF